jgi:hypothetical protein
MLRFANVSLVLLFSAVSITSADTTTGALKVPRELLVQRVKTAQETYENTWTDAKQGFGNIQRLPEWSRHLLEAEKALSDKKEDHIRALENHWKRMKELENKAESWKKAGFLPPPDSSAVKYYRIEAEIWLIESGGSLPK